MPGPKRYYKDRGRKRKRRTPYRYLGVREADWYGFHRLADKLGLSLVDTISVLVTANLKAWHIEPLTAEDLKKMDETPALR